jgi:hypothetical protein
VRSEASKRVFEGLAERSALRVGPLRLWLTQPLGMVTQLEPGAHASASLAQVVAGAANSALLGLYRREPGPMFFAHDWRNLASYESEARRVLTEWALGLGAARIARVDILLDATTSSFVRMGTAVGQAALAVGGVTMRVHYDAAAFARASEAALLRPHPGWRQGTNALLEEGLG